MAALPVPEEDVDRSASPAAVRVALATLAERDPQGAARLAADVGLRAAVVAVLGASRSMTRLVLNDGDALDVLSDLDRRPALPHGDETSLARWKRLELLRVAARDLLGVDGLRATGRLLADLADDVLRSAVRIAGDGAAGLVVVQMGKAGARELNFASDVDVLFVGEGDARRVLEIARRCFRIDADLRPEGRNGPLVRTLASYEAYWDGWAQAWEFQALLKARPVAGPAELARQFAERAGERVWGRPFGADELRQVRSMKRRAEELLARRGLSDREIKRGRGGIRDIEFSVQLLQLVHGRADPALRAPATLDALDELGRAGYVAADDAALLEAAYTFLRTVEHRLQLVEEAQVHAIPTTPPALEQLARSLGYRDDPTTTAVARLESQLVRHQAAARSLHERLFFRPLLEAFTRVDAPLTEDAARERLSALGFADAVRTREAVLELTRGLKRSSRLMGQLLPLLLEWLSESPDPDLGLLGLRQLASGHHRADRMVAVFRESSEAARRLCVGLGTSRLLAAAAERQPELIGWLVDDDDLRPRPRQVLGDEAREAMAIRQDEARVAALQRLRQAETFRIAMADLLDLLDGAGAVGAALTDLADSLLHAALATAEPEVPMAVVALGRLGGAELGYASDLDVVLVHGGRGPADQAAAERVASRFRRLLLGDAPAHTVWPLDMDLRPEGRQGSIAPSVELYRRYVERWAQTWERQALVRARPVAGDASVLEAFEDATCSWVWERPFTDAEAREVRRLKARMERERIPAGEDPSFHLKLGPGSLSDVEWTVQLLQLSHRVREPSTLPALDALVATGAVDPTDAEVLATAWRFCESTRNRWYLVKGGPGDSLPVQADQLRRLARSMGTTASELRDVYRRVTRRSRSVVERLFYNGG